MRTLGAVSGPLVFTADDGEPLEEKVLRRLLERQPLNLRRRRVRNDGFDGS